VLAWLLRSFILRSEIADPAHFPDTEFFSVDDP
jgi:hypothetical protein